MLSANGQSSAEITWATRRVTLYPGVLLEAEEAILGCLWLSRGDDDELVYRIGPSRE